MRCGLGPVVAARDRGTEKYGGGGRINGLVELEVREKECVFKSRFINKSLVSCIFRYYNWRRGQRRIFFVTYIQ